MNQLIAKLRYNYRQTPLKIKLLFLFALLLIFLIPVSLLLASRPIQIRNYAQETLLPTSTPTPSANYPSPTGEQNTLVIMYNFRNDPNNRPFTKKQVEDAIFTGPNSLNAFYRENSYGKTWFTGDVIGWYTIPFDVPEGSCSDSEQLAIDQAVQNGYDPKEYTRLILLRPEHDAICGPRGAGSPAGNPTITYLYGNLDPYVIWHEVGHNIKFGHSNIINCYPNQIANYSACATYSYGEYQTIMGSGPFDVNAPFRNYVGWLKNTEVAEVKRNGIYKIHPLESTKNETKLLKIKKPDTNEYYYISYRQPIGFDSGFSPYMYKGAYIHLLKILQYHDEAGDHDYPESFLIVTSPKDSYNDDENAPLTDGKTFYDQSNQIRIRQMSHNKNEVTLYVFITDLRRGKPISIGNNSSLKEAPQQHEIKH